MQIGYSNAVSQVLNNFDTRNTYYFDNTNWTLAWIVGQIEDYQTIWLMDVFELYIYPISN
jgi:hypothetical protein